MLSHKASRNLSTTPPMTPNDLWTPPNGFVLAGPSSCAFHHLQTRGLIVDVQKPGWGVHTFHDGSALVTVDDKPFPLPLRQLNGPHLPPHTNDLNRIRTLHTTGWKPHELWWANVSTDPLVYGQKMLSIADLLATYLAGKIKPFVSAQSIEFLLIGATPDVPEYTPAQDAHLKTRILRSPPHTSAHAHIAQAILDNVSSQIHPFLFDADNPPRFWRWTHHLGHWFRETPFLFRITLSIEHTPNAHETMRLAHKLRAYTGLEIT